MSFSEQRRVVKTMLLAGEPFERIEAHIEQAPGFDEEERALLWLYAWVGAEPSVVARELGRVRLAVVLGV